MSDQDDIESLLADILSDKPKPTPSQAVMHVVANSGPEALTRAAEVAMDDPETFLEGLFAAEPADVAAATEVTSELVLADIGITPSVTTQQEMSIAELMEAVAEGAAITHGPGVGMTDAVFTDTEIRTNAVSSLKMPTFTAEDFAETMDIRNFATLVTLNTTRWHAKVKDRQASKDAAHVSHADEASFETRKRLLVGADGLLRNIHKAIDEARAAHYAMTLPWSTTSLTDDGRRTGGRLLPNTLFVEYTTEMARKRKAMQDALDAFVPKYPELIEIAKAKLGKRFDPREYPNTSSIRTRFDLSFDFQPIPKGDDFAGLPQAQLDALASKVNDNTRVMAENAMQDVWTRMYEAVDRMAERLSSPDKLFHNTLVQNVRDVARLMAHLNVTGDTKVEALRQKVEKYLCQHEPKVLRENAVKRAETAAWAASIIQEMNK